MECLRFAKGTKTKCNEFVSSGGLLLPFLGSRGRLYRLELQMLQSQICKILSTARGRQLFVPILLSTRQQWLLELRVCLSSPSLASFLNLFFLLADLWMFTTLLSCSLYSTRGVISLMHQRMKHRGA